MSTPPAGRAPLRIFIVENHPATLKYYRLFLEAEGHEVCSAGTIAEALTTIPESNCSVLISDVGLPDGDGWELLEKLKKSGRPYPAFAIAVSGYGSPSDKEKSKAAGFRHHLLKPFEPDVLVELLAEV
jgi:two-component system CheB/CheR fusion protein